MNANPTLRVWHSAALLISMGLMGGVTLPAGAPEGPVTSEIAVVGADFSSVLGQEANAQVFEDQGQAAPLEDILSANGVNYSRIRLWVDPEPGSGDLESALAIARRSKSAGMSVLLDLHYSDTWADQLSQTLPAAWSDLDQQELVDTVRTYTQDVVSAFAEQGTPVEMVQVGNEVTNGMLWSWGKTELDWGEYWDGFAELYKAGAEGAIAATPDTPPRIMIHSHAGGDIEAALHFFDRVVEHDMPFDVIGLTYYPFWGGALPQFGRGLNLLANRYDRDIIVVETGYPWTLDAPAGCSTVIDDDGKLPERWNYPATPDGQAAYFGGLRDVLEQVPDGHGLGFFVWEPAWLPDVRLAGVCNRYAGLTLFDWYGKSLPALSRLAG
ncbi:glycoside hydrolase family 53 protein [Arthrobacter sp. MDT3-44]